MPFPARSVRKPGTSAQNGPIFAVGQQAFIDCPGGREDRASLLDEKGAVVVGSLIDGTEVEIVGWVPRGSATRYFVRSTRSQLAGWLGVAHLRTTRTPRLPGALTAKAMAWIPARLPGSQLSKPRAATKGSIAKKGERQRVSTKGRRR